MIEQEGRSPLFAAVAVAAVAVVAGGSAAPQANGHDRLGLRRRRATWRLRRARARTAQGRIKPVNKAGRYKLKLITCNTQGNKPTIAKACAAKLLGQGADIIMTTCDVDYAAPVVQ